ncbi:MAG: hypothetical protein NVS3B3_20200 [Aquirhabdus sp.]
MVTTLNNTLHLLAAAPRFWSTLIPEILAVWQEGDLILLLAEGAQGFNSRTLEQFKKIAVLDSDLARLEVENDEVPSQIKIATTADWATWTVQYQRTVTWR